MKITIISPNGPPEIGGNAMIVKMLSCEFAKMGNAVNLVLPKFPRTKNEILNGVRVNRISIPVMNYGRSLIFSVYSAKHIVRLSKDSDVLQFDTFVGSFIDWITGKISKKPSLLIIHGLLLDLWEKVSRNSLEKIIFPKIDSIIPKLPFDFFITPCDYTKNTLINIGIDKKKIKRIYWGINHQIFHKGYKPTIRKRLHLENKFIIGWLGRLNTDEKNLECLFEAFKTVKENIKESVLLLAGPGFDYQIENIKKFGLVMNKDVFYCGYFDSKTIKKQAEWYSSIDVFVTPSLIEGFGLPLVEAQACGTPVICFNISSLPEVVKNWKTGLVINKHNSEALADAIIKFYEKSLKNRFSKNCPKWSKQFNWQQTAKEYIKVYERFI